MSRRRLLIGLSLLVALVAVVALLVMRPRPPAVVERPTATPLPGATAAASPTSLPPRPRLGYTPVPENTLSPVVVRREPERGAELSPNGVIRLVFDRPMDQAAVAGAFSVSPAVAGRIEWPDARTLLFQPAAPLARNSVYDVALTQAARAQDGAPLNGAYQFRFATSGYLEAAQVIPAPGAQDVAVDATITVIFNRPVVPLVSSPDLASLPHPLRLEPAVSGAGEWLNTSVYLFRPDQPLAGGTTYTATIAGSLTDAAGNPLQAPFSWQFAVAAPQVIAVTPADGSNHASVEPTLRVQFNQPIDAATAQSAFSLRDGGAAVPFTLGVEGETLLITPTERLQFDRRYTARLAAGLPGAAGGAGLAQDFAWSFQTAPLPRIVRTEPANGVRNASPFTDFSIIFNTPIDPATVMDNLQMTPPISPTQVFTYFNDYDYSFHLGFGVQPSTDYTVRIGPDIADPYGNTTGQALLVRFRTGPLPPRVTLVAPDSVGSYAAGEPARVVLNSVNLAGADLELFAISPRDLMGYRDWRTQPPPAANLLRRWTASLATPPNQAVNTRVDLRADGGPLDPGAYLLILKDPQRQWDTYHLMVVSAFNLTLKTSPRETLVWANRLDDGRPAPSLALTVYTDDGQALGSMTTDANGVARLSLERPLYRTLYAMSACDQSPCPDFAAVGAGWSNGISLWEFGLQPAFGAADLNAFVYTDRPIYRPGQTVEFKGILRAERDVAYSLPERIGSVEVTIFAPDGAQVYQQRLNLSQNGTWSDRLTLTQGAALGQYVISVQAGDYNTGFPFTVAAYRPPEFQVAVTPPAPEVVRGSPVRAEAAVSYFFGGPVADVPVDWNVLVETHRFSPAGLERYSFDNSDDPWICFYCWWEPSAPPTPLLSGSGMTDAQGRLAIDLPADLRNIDGTPITGSLRLIMEATATGRDNQVIAGRGELIAHAGDVYVGLATRDSLATAGQTQTLDLVAVDTQGRRRAGQSIAVTVERYEWQNTFVPGPGGVGGRWQTSEQRTTVEQQTLTTDATGAAVLTFTPAQGGVYRVSARVTDSGGRSVTAGQFVWVAGRDFVPWRRTSNDRFSLISDRTSYRPGETADILIPSPFQGPTWALVTVERGGILQHEVFQLQSNSHIYRLPLRDEHAPNIFVSVVLVTGPEAPGRPADYKIGYLPLQVEPVAQSLRITLTPDQVTALPGDLVTYQVQAADATGAGVAAEFSLDLVDKAVLSLLPREADAIRRAFYGERGLGVSTASGLSISTNRLLERLAEQIKDIQPESGQVFGEINEGLAGGVPAVASTQIAAAPVMDRAAEGGATAPPGVTLRQEFADTAFWQADFRTDANGRGSLAITLPDNLTTWTLRGVALAVDTRVGEGVVEVVATKPLLIRPVTPRFFVVGDRAELAANVSNTTGQPLRAEVALSAAGVAVTTPLTVTVDIPAQSERRVTWMVEVSAAAQADLIFSAVAGEFSDAARPRLATGPNGSLPIYRYSVAETVGTGGQLATGGARTEIIALPPDLDASQGEVTLRLDPSLAAGMRDGLTYLEHYEFEATEPIVSRFLPNVLTYRALQKLGVSNPELEARLPALVQEGLERLALRQHNDGGWGWWDEQTSNPHVSAYVVFGLLRTREAGFAVDSAMLDRGVAFVRSRITQATVAMAPFEADEQALLLFVLAESGQPDRNANQALLRLRDKLSVYARAFLAMALQRADPNDPGINTLRADLNSSAILSATGAHWEEDNRDWWAMNSDTRSTAIALAALVRIDPANQLNPNVVRWLMVARQDGIWETTQETAWALIALTDWMEWTGELTGSYDYAAWLNDADLTAGQVNATNIAEPIIQRIAVADLLADQGNRLTVGRGEGPGMLYYTAHLRAFLPVENVRALDRGIIVQRRYTLASCTDGRDCPEVTSARVGDVIRVDLTLIAPRDLYYLRVEDPLPAGAEAIDTGLATTSLLAQGPQLSRQSPERWGWGWWWRWFSRSELRDEKVALFADYLAKGTYEYSYTMRLTLPGEFRVIPTTAGEFYFPEVYGRSDGRLLTVR